MFSPLFTKSGQQAKQEEIFQIDTSSTPQKANLQGPGIAQKQVSVFEEQKAEEDNDGEEEYYDEEEEEDSEEQVVRLVERQS